MTVLAARDLRKSFGGVPAVDGVSLSVEPGEVVAMIGPNGAGKSTCFAMLGGQLRPDSGSVTLRGQDITARPAAALSRLGIGRTFQITASFASMTVRENVQTALLTARREVWRVWRPARSYYREQAEALLARVALSHQAGRAAGVLAYGDLKRLDLALALAGDPAVLLMDEPTAGMAAEERRDLMALVRSLGLAVLFTEHDMAAVFGSADRILVLHRGRVIAQGDAAKVRNDPAVQELYLGTPA